MDDRINSRSLPNASLSTFQFERGLLGHPFNFLRAGHWTSCNWISMAMLLKMADSWLELGA